MAKNALLSLTNSALFQGITRGFAPTSPIFESVTIVSVDDIALQSLQDTEIPSDPKDRIKEL